MKSLTLKKIQQQFIGKICTILTLGSAKSNLQDTQFADLFTGKVDAIDEDGILTTHHITNCKNFYFFPHIIGIIEEQVLYEDNPEDKKIIDELKRQAEQKPQQASSPFANIDLMANLAKQAKELEKS